MENRVNREHQSKLGKLGPEILNQVQDDGFVVQDDGFVVQDDGFEIQNDGKEINCTSSYAIIRI